MPGAPVLGPPVKGAPVKGPPVKGPPLLVSVKGGDLSIIVGDGCRPKYFGIRTLSLRLGEKRVVTFYWQKSYAEYFSTCLAKRLFDVYNPELL